MKERKVPMRTCSVTREKFDKKDLIRIVRTPVGEVKIDLTGKLNGHGAYIKKDVAVIEKARKTNVIGRMLEVKIDDTIYEELIRLVSES